MPAKKKNAGATAAKKNAKKSQEQAYNAARSKAKDQYLQDKTFGLKNKKKSKNVQQFIHQTTMSVKGDEIRNAQKKKDQAKKKKEQKKAEEDAMKALFGGMEKTVRGKDGKKLTRNEIAAKKKEEEQKELERKKKEEFWNNLTLEEKIEHKRAQLDTTKCTPVTPESFAVWKAAKLKKKQEAEAKRASALSEMKKSGKKNKNMKVSGRELFAMNKDLFKDDSAAVDDSDILAMSEPEEDADEDSDNEDRGLLDSDSDMDSDSDDDGDKKKAAEPTKAAAPPAAPSTTATVKGNDGEDLAVQLQEDLYLNDDGLDDLDDLDDLEDD